jgi:uncharacterized protein YgiM (DUF1202 family)
MSPKRFFVSFSLAAVFLALLLLVGSPRQASAADPSWYAQYWNNINLSGTPTLTRNEDKIDHYWGDSSYASLQNRDYFSVRWTRNVYFDAGTYRFTAVADDRVRVWIDHQLVIDSWFDTGVRTVTADRTLSAGDHFLKVEYGESIVIAQITFSWAKVSTSISGWQGQYFANRSLSGTPALVRDDANVDFNWGAGAPAAGLPSDNFSVRWTRSISFYAGRYRFTTVSDDGVRLWVNGVLLIDRWQDQNTATYSAEIDLPSASVPIKLEYYEATGGARVQLTWAATNLVFNNWRGEYFANPDLAGGAAALRDDANIDFNWGTGSPIGGVGSDNFSVRWTRTLTLPAGRYQFTTRTDDGVRLWVNNQLLIDRWVNQPLTTYTAEIVLYGGSVPVKMESFDRTGYAEAHLSWKQLSSGDTGTGGIGTATVNAYWLNVRNGPGIEYSVTTQVSKGTILNLLGYRNATSSWIMIALANGTQGWVHTSYVTTSVPVSSLTVWNGQGGGDTGGQKTATVTTYWLNVRTGPGTAYSVTTTIAKGTVVTLTHRNAQATWARITLANGTSGWVNASYLQSSTSIGSLPVWTG